jgi:hypothetical protein
MPEDSKTYKLVFNEIEQFLSTAGDYPFTAGQIDKQFNYQSREAKNDRWHVLDKLVKANRLEKLGVGKYRQPNCQLSEINWWEANVQDTVKVTWPLELEKYVKTYHKSINIVAGAPGAGKTAFLLDFILRNMNNPMGLAHFTNDMTSEEIKERFSNADVPIPTPPPFKTFDRADNFGEVVVPDKINVIDYLDLNSELYLIGDEIEKIYQKLNGGIAVIGIQKKPYQELGIGGIYSEKRAKLYFSLDTIKEGYSLYHKLTIPKARGRVIPEINPKLIEVRFQLDHGIRFVVKSVSGVEK